MNYRFRNFELDTERSTLTRGGHRLRIEPMPFRVLAALLASAPDVVSRDELIRELWPGGRASPGSLARAVREIRRVLRESAAPGGTLRTARGRGYAIDTHVARGGASASEAPERWTEPGVRGGSEVGGDSEDGDPEDRDPEVGDAVRVEVPAGPLRPQGRR